MLKANKSIPAMTRTGNQYFITTDEKCIITGVSPYLASVTAKTAGNGLGTPIQELFTANSLNTNYVFTPGPVTPDPFYTCAWLKLRSGLTLATLWVVTPVFDPLLGKVTELQWTGCTINDHTSVNPLYHLISTAAGEFVGRDDQLLADLPASLSSGKPSGHALNESIYECLVGIGQTCDVDKVLLYECARDGQDNVYLQQKTQWYSHSCDSGDNKRSYTAAARIRNVLDLMAEGKWFSAIVREIENKYLRTMLELQNIQAVLLHPLFVDDKLWGVVCCGQCYYERYWTTEEVVAVRPVVSALQLNIESRETGDIQENGSENIRALHDELPGMSIVVNATCQIIQVSHAMIHMLGFAADTLVNKSAFDFVHPQDVRKLKIEFSRILAEPSYQPVINIRLRHVRNDWVWTEARIRQSGTPAVNTITVNFKDQSKQKVPHTLSSYSETMARILNSITDGFAAVDKDFKVKFWNIVAEEVTGIKKENIVGKMLWEEYPHFISSPLYVKLQKAIEDQTSFCFEHHMLFLDRWFDATAYPHADGLFIYFKDITTKKKQEMFLALEKNVLEINSEPASTLKHTVDFFLEGLKNIHPALICSVLILDENDKMIRHLSAPGLPAPYIEAIDGTPLASNTGSFGESMYTRRMVVASDIATDPLWANNKYMALQHGLQACWSLPILNTAEEVVGSLVCYYTEPKAPTEEEISLIERTVNLLKIIIENKRAEEKVRVSNERYIMAARATNQAIWDWDVKKDVLYWGEGFYSLFGYKADYKVNTFNFWQKHIHPDDREKVRKGIWDFMKNKTPHLWVDEYRFKRSDGNYSIVINKGYLICDQKGDMLRMVGSIEDVTERKRLERKLISQEIEKQKLVAHAVVDAQEKERAKISKELHDNVNQILSTAKLFLEVAKTNAKERTVLIDRSAEHIIHAINEIRNLSQSLVPPSISDIGLGESIKDLLQNIAVKKTLKAEFHSIGDIEKSINANQKLMLFRIIQEQVNNILKHAEAKNLFIQISVDTTVIELVITDDGKGFDPALIRYKKGTGLSNITSRVDLYNGKVKIITAPGKGCKLKVNVVCIH